ncbi:MAG: NAD-dependent epimerase/dehydratase family protein [Ignavibacteriae bacterium]|nr:NAD-dependent epimerase/dehydratase family protein [Ignavibacteriota bacterium]
MQNIIITGATGFIGRRLIKEVLKNHPLESILCLIRDREDELEISGRKILEELKVSTKKIDLPSGRGMEDLPRSPKLVIHLAASTESGDEDHSCNDIGTRNLLDSLSPFSAETNFIFTSTAAVYSGRKDTEIPINESTKAVTSNEYGRSKIRAEEILKNYSEKSGFKLTVLRLATVWGEGTRKDGLFDSMNKLIKKGSIISRLNWPGKTSLIHVDNVAQIITHLSSRKQSNKEQTIVLSHEGKTLSEISEVIHKKLNIEYKPIKLPNVFWKTSDMFVKRSNSLENALPSKLYNTFWRLNLILNDSLYCKPDEFKEKLPEINLDMIDFKDY